MKKPKYPVLLYSLKSEETKKACEYTRREVINGCVFKNSVAIRATEETSSTNWFAATDQYRLVVLGPSIFWKKLGATTLTCKEGKLYGTMVPVLLEKAAQAFHIDWIEHDYVKHCLKQRRDLWQDVFAGKVTNPEMLLKRFSKKYFKGVYSYKTLKEYFRCTSHLGGIDLWSIYYYTSNPDLAIRKCLEENAKEYRQILKDMLHYCNLFGDQKVNPNWSIKRMEEEHREQIIRDMVENPPKNLSEDYICSPLSIHGMEVFRQEKECYIEATYMKNCTWRCYWKRCARGEYMLFKGKLNGQYIHMGMYVDLANDEVSFDQAKIRGDHNPRPETLEACEEFVLFNTPEILAKAKEILKLREQTLIKKHSWINDNSEEIPW